MKSWASIVSNPPSTQAATRAAATRAAATPREDDIFILKPTKLTKPTKGPAPAPAEPISEKQESGPLYQCMTPSENTRPSHKTLIRPGAPTVAPIFKNDSEKKEWDNKEYEENCKYSNEIYHQEMEKWRTEKRWRAVPNMTSMTKDEEAAGFYKV